MPPYARRSKSLDTLIPILYLKGVSTSDFAPALAALLGKDAPGLSATTIARLKEVWTDEHKRWSERDLSAKSYVYVWADGVYLQARLEDEAQCILVIIGATITTEAMVAETPKKKEAPAMTGGRGLSMAAQGRPSPMVDRMRASSWVSRK